MQMQTACMREIYAGCKIMHITRVDCTLFC